MRAKEFLIEANNLGVGELRAVRGGQPRYLKFLSKVKNGTPFTTKDGEPFTVDPKQYRELSSFFADPANSGSLTLRSTDGKTIKAADLRKTPEFGGQQPAFDQTEPAGKEALPAKPSQVFQTKDIEKLNPKHAAAVKQMLDAGAFYANELYDKIVASPVLQNAGDFGKTVIDLANQINQGTMPNLVGVDSTYASAIRDYSGEFLGVLATLKGLANFPNQKQFFEFLGASNLNDLLIYFPKATNNPLADSIAVQNKKTKHIINVSSKGGKKGAPPSLDNLKVPDEVRNVPEFSTVVGFFDEAHSASAKEQPFRLMNYLYNNGATIGKEIPKYYEGLLPFSDQDIGFLTSLMTKQSVDVRPPRKFIKIYNKFDGDDTNVPVGGTIHYVVNKDLIFAINEKNAIPDFRKIVLEILGFNFVQLFTDFKGKSKNLTVRVLWPAKVDGKVEVYSKSYAAEPGKGKLSFSVS